MARLTASWRGSAGGVLPDRYAALFEAADSEIAAALKALPVAVPCARGCDHCCRFNEIIVSRYEGVLLVRHIESLAPETRALVVARILASQSRSGGGRESPCVLLSPDGCAAYASRPLPCRAYHSISEPACRARLQKLAPDPPNVAATRVVEFAALEVSNAAKHPVYEVNSLLARIYAEPIKIARWAAGDGADEPDLMMRPRVPA